MLICRVSNTLEYLQVAVVGQLFGMALLYLFLAGLMGVAANLHWLG
jgi:hypothetical protein